MNKILVFAPSGAIRNRDDVCSYELSSGKYSRAIAMRYLNVGDLLVYDSSLKLLDFDEVEVLNLGRVKTEPGYLDRINEECSFCFIRGSNFLRPGLDWGPIGEIFEKLRMPIVPFGVGAQSFNGEHLPIPKNMEYCFKVFSDKCHSIGVRGEYSAEVLERLKIYNYDVIGCPSFFRHRNPDLKINLKKQLSDLKKIGFTLRREFTEHAAVNRYYFDFQKFTIKDLSKRYDLTIFSQGEVPEKILSGHFKDIGDESEKKSIEDWAIKKLEEVRWFNPDENDEDWRNTYIERLFYTETIRDYDLLVPDFDLFLGCRLHGNVTALANGIPAIYFLYDMRIREIAELFHIPSYDIFSYKDFCIEDLYNQSLFDRFNHRYRLLYDRMKAFLERNSVKNRM